MAWTLIGKGNKKVLSFGHSTSGFFSLSSDAHHTLSDFAMGNEADGALIARVEAAPARWTLVSFGQFGHAEQADVDALAGLPTRIWADPDQTHATVSFLTNDQFGDALNFLFIAPDDGVEKIRGELKGKPDFGIAPYGFQLHFAGFGKSGAPSVAQFVDGQSLLVDAVTFAVGKHTAMELQEIQDALGPDFDRPRDQ